MAALSGKKNYDRESTMSGPNPIGNPRSGQKYLPVRISTAHFENHLGPRNAGSSRKTIGLSTHKPIRNLHLLLESPKRTARKRLDNLYDCSKPKENVNLPKIKAQVLSAKKMGQKTPVTSAKKCDTKSEKTKFSQNSRQSRLLPPGTITHTFLNGRNSLASKTFIHKPCNNKKTLVQKNSQAKRPSDVPEESPQPLETSLNSSGDDKKLPTLNYTKNKSTENIKEVDNNGLFNNHKDSSPSINPQDEKERLLYCCKCSGIVNGSNQSQNDAEVAGSSIKIVDNPKEVTDENSMPVENKAQVCSQRPTVIVMQKEIAPQLPAQNFEQLVQISTQDGSYSEILSLQPSANSTIVDESLLFKQTENACTRLEMTRNLDSEYKSTEFVLMLVEQRKYLAQSILDYEKNLMSMKLMLGNIDTELGKQKSLNPNMKLKALLNLNSKGSSENSEASLEEGLEFGQETSRPKGAKKSGNRKSLNVESRAEKKEKGSSKDELTDSQQKSNGTENIENEPPQRRRSARLAGKTLGDLSLSVVENTPAIGNQKKIKQAKSKPCTPSMITPLRSAKWGRRSERPLREYMVLKSAIKFLNTPDSRRYRIGSDEKVKIRESLDKSDEALLSDKLLKELHDLYATP